MFMRSAVGREAHRRRAAISSRIWSTVTRRLLLALGLTLWVVCPSAAQSRFPLSIQLSGGVVKPFSDKNLDGSVGGSYPASLGFEGQVRYSSAGPVSVGFGFQISDLGDYDGSRLSVFFAEPRLRIQVRGGRVGPYLSVRGGFGRISFYDPADLTPPFDVIGKNGASIGGGGGVLIQFSRRVGFDLGALFNSAPDPVGKYGLLRGGLSIGLGQPRRLGP